MPKILLIGPQGSGKGTQAEILASRLGIPALSMGQLLRDEVASGSKIGKKTDRILKAGNLVSDEVAAEVLRQRLTKPDAKGGYVLDGYPRNLAQMAVFDFDVPTHVIVIEVPREESLRRLSGRLTCDRCGFVSSEAMGASLGAPCEKNCGGKYIRRADDTVEAISRRLDIYANDTQPMLEQYKQQGLVHAVDGVGSVEEVAKRVYDAAK